MFKIDLSQIGNFLQSDTLQNVRVDFNGTLLLVFMFFFISIKSIHANVLAGFYV